MVTECKVEIKSFVDKTGEVVEYIDVRAEIKGEEFRFKVQSKDYKLLKHLLKDSE